MPSRAWELEEATKLCLWAIRDYTGLNPYILHAQNALRIAERAEEERDTEPAFELTPEEQRVLAELRRSTESR
jgi:hypothetical protein